jgi:hypothetical protein
MSAFTVTAVKSVSVGGPGAQKRAIIQCTGTASYDTGGSVLDLSSANTTLTGFNNEAAFTLVHGLSVVNCGTAASDKYRFQYLGAAAFAPATGVIKARDLTAASDAEVSSTTDLSATTWTFEVFGV